MRILKLAVATLSWLRARRTSETVVKCEFWSSPLRLATTACHSTFQNPRFTTAAYAKMYESSAGSPGQHAAYKNHHFTTVSDIWPARSDERVAERASKFAFHHSFGRPMSTKQREGCQTTQADSHFTSVLDVRWARNDERVATFCFCWMNPLVGFGGSMARNCGETQIFYGNCRKHRAKRSFWKLCSMKFGGSLARNARFGGLFCEISKKPRTKRSFWKLVLWNFEEASHETIVLEAFSVKMVGSIARNARFASLCCEISKKPRTKRSFWKLVLWNFEEASHETIALEAFSVKIVGSIARNARFASLCCEISKKPRTKRSFWKLVLWNFEEASHETIVLEACAVKFRRSLARNDLFGSLCCEISRKPRTKRSFWKLFLWKWSEASRETLVLRACAVKFRRSLARNDLFGSLFFEISRKPRTKRSFWKLFLWKWSEASRETLVLRACAVKIVGNIARNARFGSLFCEIWRKPRTKRSLRTVKFGFGGCFFLLRF